ncbi:hypothetical protein K788_0008412 [Paraburkholderia caribensis MBA4]|uniref:Uncharacterized protein n=2 Tax=Paraburkholderia caribensis TaxID=75105 RepID=A0A0P0R8G0_9BURK|nr:hypothetical protein K788_0008412 [Paraburkholderia caribensis MBA4]
MSADAMRNADKATDVQTIRNAFREGQRLLVSFDVGNSTPMFEASAA